MSRYYNILDYLLSLPFAYVLTLGIFTIIAQGPYSYINLIFTSFHAWTGVVIVCSYGYTLNRLKFIPIPLRQIYSFSLVVAGMHLYDSIYSIFSLANGYSWSIFPIVSLIFTIILILFLETKNMFLEFRPLMLISLTILVWCFILLSQNGFFEAVRIYETVGGPDPNMNPIWLISKVAGFMVFPFATASGPLVREIRWLLI